jgi:hypothetical protein
MVIQLYLTDIPFDEWQVYKTVKGLQPYISVTFLPHTYAVTKRFLMIF